jgi:ABC-2 type transport system permease protein
MTSGTGGFALGALPLLEREIVRFYRQRNRIVGALLQPLVFWLLLGFGLRSSFHGSDPKVDYLEYVYPGIVVLTLLFTAIFATISIIEDRKEGFLQGVLASPVPRSSIVLGKVCGAAAIACFQGVLYLGLAPFAGIPLGIRSALLAAAILALLSIGLAALGFMIAWRLDSTQGFHAIMNVFLIPMWLLSGAFFPADGAPAALSVVMTANPLTYGMRAFRDALYGRAFSAAAPHFLRDLLITAAAAAAAVVLAAILARRSERA